MTSAWRLHDAVTIAAEGNFPALDGVIAYMAGDTVGVRLTGESQGMGDHSGSMDGIDYFDCPLNSGVLTTTSKISKRALSWSEEQELRRELQPRISYPPPSSIPLSGLSPSALARMAQLQQRMQASTPQAPKNQLPQVPKTPISKPAEITEPPTLEEEKKTEEDKPEEKILSRLELLRQRKEAIRQKKLALQEKVQDKKEKQQQQQQQRQPDDKDETQPQTTTVSTVTPEASAEAIKKEGGAVEPPQKQQKQERRQSRDSLANLWIRELRHESPPAAARYGDDNEDDAEYSQQAQEILKQPSLDQENKAIELANEEDDIPASSHGRLTRLQQLRQKKRLLEALPSSITVSAKDAEGPPRNVAQEANSIHSRSPLSQPLGLASMAVASAAAMALANDGDDDASNSTLSTQMSEMDLEDENDADHHRHHAVPTESFQESVTITEEENAEPGQPNSHKRRRMLGLGFLPTNKRQQKRRDTGRGKEGHQ